MGGGTGPELEGYISIDRKTGSEIYPLAYPDNSVQSIRASHCLEHLSHRDTLAAVRDWARVLKPGGRLRIAVPNMTWIVEQMSAGVRDPLLELYVMGGHTDADDHHGALFSENKLRALFRYSGLRKVRHWTSEIADCASLPVSLNLEGIKPVPVKVTGTTALMSLPRYMQTSTFDVIQRACREAGDVPIRCAWGAYYHEVLTKAIENTLDDSPETKYFLFIDYDSVCDSEDIRELYRLMENNPHADAVCALQIGRINNKALMVVLDENGKRCSQVTTEWLDQDLGRIESAHFGLTMVRRSVFEKTPKPWFIAVPGKDGSWSGDDYVGADVQAWRNFVKAGFKIYSANQVAIGHLQETCLWPSRDLSCITQEISEYRKQGSPPESWR